MANSSHAENVAENANTNELHGCAVIADAKELHGVKCFEPDTMAMAMPVVMAVVLFEYPQGFVALLG